MEVKKIRYLPSWGTLKTKYEKNPLDKKSLIFLAYKNFAENQYRDYADLKFSLTKIFHYYNKYNKPVITCFRVRKDIRSPLFPDGGDSCNYYITAARKWVRWWNIDEAYYNDFDEGYKTNRANVPKYVGVSGIVIDANIIDSFICENSMASLVIAFPSDTTVFDEYNKPILNEHFSLRYEYAIKEPIKAYLQKYNGARFISKYGVESIGIPQTLFILEDPFSNY